MSLDYLIQISIHLEVLKLPTIFTPVHISPNKQNNPPPLTPFKIPHAIYNRNKESMDPGGKRFF